MSDDNREAGRRLPTSKDILTQAAAKSCRRVLAAANVAKSWLLMIIGLLHA